MRLVLFDESGNVLAEASDPGDLDTLRRLLREKGKRLRGEPVPLAEMLHQWITKESKKWNLKPTPRSKPPALPDSSCYVPSKTTRGRSARGAGKRGGS